MNSISDLQLKPLRIAVIGTYVPRQCGIATFTSDLCNSLLNKTIQNNGDIFVIAMDDIPQGYNYPELVKLEIRADMARDYRRAADYINISPADVVIIQHEFGIYGGEAGNYLNTLLQQLRKPVITTLHTILDNPLPEYRNSMDKIIKYSERLVVMSHRGIDMLNNTYDVPREKVAFIPHGIPDVPFIDPNFHKDEFNVAGRRVILTFGLLSPGKGIENMINALPAIAKKFPDVVYIILGATHPAVKRRYGEEYRNSLKKLAKELGVTDNVMFVNKFVELDELCKYIASADVYITPYPNKEQITSGTLAYAVGAGKAVVSTPYWYAEELLADGRGSLVDFNNHTQMAQAIIHLFEDEVTRHAMRKKAYLYARNMTWENVAKEYIKLAYQVIEHRHERPKPIYQPRRYDQRSSELPEINLQHLQVLTDHVGLFQHARYTIPFREHGYCTDDVARGLVFCAMHWLLYEDSAILRIIHTYLSFLLDAYNPASKRFRNFLSYNLDWLDEEGTEDSHGRALWGLGSIVANAPNHSILALSSRLFLNALPTALEFSHPRAIAFSLIGMHYYLRRFNVDTEVRRIRETLARELMEFYSQHQSENWKWCTESLTYANARIPQALIMSGQWIPDNEMVQTGLESLRWLLEMQTGEQGQLSLVGNQGWWPKGGNKARFDQQPIDATALVQACIDAYNLTGEQFWSQQARRCFEWFLGRNDLNLPIYDFITGGCRDGLHSTGVNENQGAESTLSWLIALTAMYLLNKQIEQTKEEVPGHDIQASR